ncbi:MAG TPA: EF-P beta-lysylation protein EpmB [Gammaproteobacteria bacterium]|nr:EF-P beta-lysylation protein EpmB [Gammaproteobacteria bacterium]
MSSTHSGTPAETTATAMPAALTLPSWQAALQDAVRDPGELARLLELTPAALGPAAATGFPLLVPRGFVARMRKGDPHDPLLRQVWPHRDELAAAPGFTADPVREQGLAANGLIRKYGGRVLLIASGACPLHCRYCFRREFPYAAQLAARGDWEPALSQFRKVDDAREAILSGGDPLSLSNRRLAELLARLADLGLATVRIHTRFPIAIPERVDSGLLELLGATRLRTVVVVHTNHANELDDHVARALELLRTPLTALLNQSVLLRGVNDTADTLAALSERLFACGVLPYYLHLLDPVSGAAHFDVAETVGRRLIEELRARLPGYLVPRLARETPGQLSKTVVA